MKKYLEYNNSKKVLKIVLIVLMTLFYGYMLYDKLYVYNNNISVLRILIPLLLLLLFSLGLFIKPKINLDNKKSLVLSLILTIIFIILNLFLIQYSLGYCLFDIFSFYSIKKSIFYIILNLGVISILFLIVFSISNSFKISIVFLNFLTIILSLIEYYVIQFRGVGFLAVDILNAKTAMNVMSAYSYSLNYNVFITVFILISLTPYILYLSSNTYFKSKKRLILVLFTLFTIIVFLFGINIDRVERLIKVKYYKPQESFQKKGLPICFIRSVKDLIVFEPDGYSIKKVDSILKKYESDKKSEAKNPNIIIIMDEAYTDFSDIVDLKINKDYLPFIHSLKDNTIKGELYTSIFGGGTSATEFEVLTSNSMAFVPSGINAYSAYINSNTPSLTTTLKDQNYKGLIAMHPFKPNGYSRNKVYPLLGFNEFISKDQFDRKTEIYGKHISDKGDFDRIISEYEKSKKESENPFYLFNVTMQNHSPFTCDGVKQDIKIEYKNNYPEANCYMNMLNYTDKSFEHLVKYFKEKDDKTIIAFFGDHEPKLEPEFYDEVMKTYKKEDEYINLEKNNTQFLIWANYDIKEEDNIKISANYMSSLILDIAGLNKTGYNKYTSKIRKKIPVLTKKGYIGDDNKFYKLDDEKSPYYKIISDYNNVQYNNLFDSENRLNSYFYLKK